MATFSPGANTDDCFFRIGNEAFVTDGNGSGVWNSAGRFDSANNGYGAGLRFPNITIPQGATITAATISGKAKSSGSGANAKTRIRAQAADNPSTFSTASDFKSRVFISNTPASGVDSSKVTVAVDWDSIAASVADNTTLTSPDISTVIQAIVNRAGWASGNALVLFWDDFDKRTATDGAFRTMADNEQGNPITLTVTWSNSKLSPSVVNTGGGQTVRSGRKGAATETARLLAADDFTDTAGTDLSAHVPTGPGASGSWVDDLGATADKAGVVAGGSAIGRDDSAAGSGHDNSTGFTKHSANPASANYDVEIDFSLSASGATFDVVGTLMRWAYPTEGYSVVVDNTQIKIARNAPSGAFLATLTRATTGAHTLRTKVRSSFVQALLDGTPVLGAIDAVGVTGPGKGGVRVGWSGTSNYATIDAFRLYDVFAGRRVSGGGGCVKTGSAASTVHSGAAACHGGGSTVVTGRKGARAATACNLGRASGVLTAPTIVGSRTQITTAAEDTLHPYNYSIGYIYTATGARVAAFQHTYAETASPTYGGSGGDGHNSVRVKRLAPGADPTVFANWVVKADLDNAVSGGSGPGDVNLAYGTWYGTPNTLVLTWTEVAPVLSGDAAQLALNRYSISTDDANTWSAPADLSDLVGWPQPGHYTTPDGYYELCAAPPLFLDNGDTLIVTYKRTTTGDLYDYEFVDQVYRLPSGSSTWSGPTTIFPHVAGRGYDEPFLIQLPPDHPTNPNRVICVARTYENLHGAAGSPSTFVLTYWANYSDDRGATWNTPRRVMGPGSSQPTPSGVTYWGVGNSPRMTVTAEGLVIILSRMHIWNGSGYQAVGPGYCVSADGLNWADTWLDARTGSAFDFTSANRDPSMHGQFRSIGPANTTNNLDLIYANYLAWPSAPVQAYYQLFTGASAGVARPQVTFTGVKGAGRAPGAYGAQATSGGGSPSFSYAKGPRATTSTTGGGLVLFNGATPVTPPPPLAFPASPYTPRLGPQGLWWEY